MKLKNKLGQYFTTNIELQNKVYEFILYPIQFKIVLNIKTIDVYN